MIGLGLENKSKAYNEGWNARNRTKYSKDNSNENPYKENTLEWHEWRFGWWDSGFNVVD